MSELVLEFGYNIELLKLHPDNSFDSVVTDGPYGLGKEPDPIKLLRDWIDHGYHEVKGSGFMGKTWDAFVPQPLFWKEIFRVLKPGGYLLCFFGTRTYDWGTLAIRLAGFEIRDMITWHYGSGFPKSLNISKALDKQAGAAREVIGKIKNNISETRNNISSDSSTYGIYGNNKDLTAPSTDEAKEWDGWGTALKPATEPICVARKPLVGTVASNILKYGTGGINIDACRVGLDGIEVHSTEAKGGLGNNVFGKFDNKVKDLTDIPRYNSDGRFPANVIFDEFTADLLDQQTGQLTSGKPCGIKNSVNNIYGAYAPGQPITGFGDTGGASRFFYCAKASQEERNAGCEGLEKRNGGMTSNTSGQHITRRDGGAPDPVNNFHPTVKPIALMRWLQRLVTPIGGRTLDPFAGSGTSGCSAALEGFNIVLMEMVEEYIPIIKARTTYWQEQAIKIRRQQQLEQSQQQLFT